MIKVLLFSSLLCVLIVTIVAAEELPTIVEEIYNKTLTQYVPKSVTCNLKYITNDAEADIRNINKFFELGLSEEVIEKYAKIIEDEVYPSYRDGFCDEESYLLFLFNKLNLAIEEQQIDKLLSYIYDLKDIKLANDNLEEPDNNRLYDEDIKTLNSINNLIMDTADILIGDTFIIVIFVDDPSHTWIDSERTNALNKISETKNWMEQNDPSTANVVVLYGYYNTQISSDPYDCQGDYYCECRDWMNEAVGNLGFTDSNSNDYKIDEINNFIKNYYGVDNVFPIFMIKNAGWFGADSSYSCSGEYIPRIALFYYELCFIFCSAHESDAYIHESLHAFSADDEYAGPWACDNVDDCNREVRWGYTNGNCDYCPGTQNSIMKCCGPGTSYWASPYTKGQIGWGDHDSDNTLDPLDRCMYNSGYYCNGCAAPSCSTCMQAYCPTSGGTPYCISSPSTTQCGTDYYEYGCPWGNNLSNDTGMKLHDYHCNGAGSCLDYPQNWQVDESCNSSEFCYWDGQGQGDNNYYCNIVCIDDDKDGFNVTGSTCGPVDCNDSNNNTNPGATEICDNLDNDCDNMIDEGLLMTFYQDTDLDGYGNLDISQTACIQPEGYVTDNTDCDDTDANIHPGADEICNGKDDDCNPDGLDEADVDGDTYMVCEGDCDDNNSAINPGALEICDNLDNDCNNETADGQSEDWFNTNCDGLDNDLCEEGMYSCTTGVQICSDVSANNIELCNGLDDDCNNETVDGSGETTPLNKKQEGICLGSKQICNGNWTDNYNLSGYETVENSCDGLDNDCDSNIDENITKTFYEDSDGDGYGNLDISQIACEQPDGYILDNSDCNDDNSSINPNSDDSNCNNIDDNCNDLIDEAYNSISTSCGVGACYNSGVKDCINGSEIDSCVAGTPVNETCNSLDDDCDNLTDEDPICVDYCNINITKPENMKNYNDDKVEFNISLTNKFNYLRYIDLNDKKPKNKTLCRNCDNYGVSKKRTVGFDDGFRNLTLYATNKSDPNKTCYGYVNFFVDETKPRILNQEPRDKRYCNGNFRVSYDEEFLKKVYLHYQNITVIREDCESGKKEWCDFNVSLGGFEGQNINFYFGVEDTFWKIPSKRSYTCKVDTTPAKINWLETNVSGRYVYFNISLDSKAKGITYVDNADPKKKEKTLCSWCTEYGASKVKKKSFSKRNYTLTVLTEDEAGNRDSRETSFIVV